MPELICDRHGPYDASYGSCPYCAAEQGIRGQRPPAPRPLGDIDNFPTDPGSARPMGPAAAYSPPPASARVSGPIDDLPTDPGGGAAYGQPGGEEVETEGGGRQRPRSEDEQPTELPGGAYRRGGDYDREDEVETQLPRRRRWSGEEDEADRTEVLQPAGGLLGWLVVKNGRRRGHFYKIRAGTVVGRRDADVSIDDPFISNPQARFQIENNQFVIWDFGSTNGTFVNGERIRAAVSLKENDEIRLGDTVLVLKVLE